MTTILKSKNPEFIMRHATMADAQDYLEVHKDKEASRNFMHVPKTLEQAKNAGYIAGLTTDVKLNYPVGKPFLIHRWSVKRSISLKKFEAVVTNKKALKKLIIESKIKKFVLHVFGRQVSDKINVLIHLK